MMSTSRLPGSSYPSLRKKQRLGDESDLTTFPTKNVLEVSP